MESSVLAPSHRESPIDLTLDDDFQQLPRHSKRARMDVDAVETPPPSGPSTPSVPSPSMAASKLPLQLGHDSSYLQLHASGLSGQPNPNIRSVNTSGAQPIPGPSGPSFIPPSEFTPFRTAIAGPSW